MDIKDKEVFRVHFESLEELKTNLDDDVTDPYQIAKDFNLKIVEVALPSTINGFCEPISQYILINNKITDSRFKLFVIAHEVVHTLLDKHPAALENNTVNTLKTEARANKGAFYLLARNYKAITGLENDEINVLDFMNAYHLPMYFYYFVEHYLNYDNE